MTGDRTEAGEGLRHDPNREMAASSAEILTKSSSGGPIPGEVAATESRPGGVATERPRTERVHATLLVIGEMVARGDFGGARVAADSLQRLLVDAERATAVENPVAPGGRSSTSQ